MGRKSWGWSISWSPPFNSWRTKWRPPSSRTGEPENHALAIPVTASVTPGPAVTAATPSLPVSRE